MTKVLITGVAGFIGSKVANRFLSEGIEVVGVDDLSSGFIDNVPSGVSFIQLDLSSKSEISKLPSDCAAILHLAGQSSGEISFDNPVLDLNKNAVSTLNLIHHAQKTSIKQFLYASSMSVYGPVDDSPIQESTLCGPISCYGVSKYTSEQYLKIYSVQVPFTIMRMFNVYGPGQDMNNMRQGMVSIFLSQAIRDGNILAKGALNRFRDFIYIDDVVEAWYRATFNHQCINKTINIGTGVRTTVLDLINEIKKLASVGAVEEVGSTPGDQTGIYADSSLMIEILGMSELTPLERGLDAFYQWALIADKKRRSM